MKRSLVFTLIALLAVTSIVLAQQTAQVTLRTPSGDKPVANVQGTTKVVITLSAPANYTITKEESAYTIHFQSPLHAPFAEQSYEDPNVSHVKFSGSDVRLQLTAPDVVGDSYRLENPNRV